MARVSDWRVDQEARRAHHPETDICVGMALDLRDARALLRMIYRVLSKHPWAEEECERIRQHLEGEE